MYLYEHVLYFYLALYIIALKWTALSGKMIHSPRCLSQMIENQPVYGKVLHLYPATAAYSISKSKQKDVPVAFEFG